MRERKLFPEIPPGKEKFHSAVLTSFSFNFHHFEHQVVRTLRQKWISSISVFVDQRMLNELLGEVTGNLKQLSRSYCVTGVKSAGAFHPKLNFFIGYDRLLLVFGSGNITPGGHGKNHELFTGFYAETSDDKQLPLLIEAWNYLKGITQNVPGYVSKQVNQVLPSNCKLIDDRPIEKHAFHLLEDDMSVSLLYNDETSIYTQLTKAIPKDEVTRISVVSPYYDEDGQTLLNLLSYFGNAKMEVYLSPEGGLPPTKMVSNPRIVFYNWDTTKRGKVKIGGKNPFTRKLHSKLFHFKTSDSEYTILGSANATIRGIGSMTGRAANQEFCCLYRTKGWDMLNTLGVTEATEKIAVGSLIRKTTVTGDEVPNRHGVLLQLTAADLHGTKLKVFMEKPANEPDLRICILDSTGAELCTHGLVISDETTISVELDAKTLGLNPIFVYLSDNKEVRSNKQLINFLHQLYRTDPSHSNRRLQEILTVLDAGEVNLYQIIDFLNNISRPRNQTTSNSSSGAIVRDPKDEQSDLTYEQAVEALNGAENSSDVIRNYPASRIWDIISRIFRQKSQAIQEEIIDEEEEAVAEQGQERSIDNTPKDEVVMVSWENYHNSEASLRKMVGHYLESVNRLSRNSKHQRSHIDLSEFLLISHLITVVCCFTTYKFEPDEKTVAAAKAAKKLEELNDLIDTNWNLVFFELYQELMMQCLEAFSRLVLKTEVKQYNQDEEHEEADYDKYLKQSSYHIGLYVYLISRRTPDQIVRDKLQLIGLNLLYLHMTPDSGFSAYVEDMSKSLLDRYFDAKSTVEWTDKLVEFLHSDEIKKTHFVLKGVGVCKIIDEVGTQVAYSTILDLSRKFFQKKTFIRRNQINIGD